jgi:2-polyprenyl-6-methoxyphenol hydroxylase-like FAD-dependent oxidoreductase
MKNCVLVVGAGPTGLTAALELSRFDIPVRIIDVQPEPSKTSRAIGVQARTLELFAQRGIAEELVARGHPVQGGNIYGDGKHLFRLDFSGIESRFNYALVLPQTEIENALTRRIEQQGGAIERGVELVAFSQEPSSHDPNPVEAVLRHADGRLEEMRTSWLIAADGAHSLVRRTLDLPFEGKAMDAEFVLGDMRVEGALAASDFHIFSSAHGMMGMFPYGDGRFRIVASTPVTQSTQPMPAPNLDQLQRIYDQRAYIPATFSDLTWSSSFRINSRMVGQLKLGRVLLGGDAANVHSPAGAQGMNAGIQDMINLSWKLALVIKGRTPSTILDTYEAERLPVMRSILTHSEYLTRLVGAQDPIVRSLIGHFGPWIGNAHFVQENASAQFSQLAVEYRSSPLSEQHARSTSLHAGDRVPDFVARVRNGDGNATSLLDLLDPWLFTLLSAGPPRADTAQRFAPWSDMVRVVEIEAPAEGPHRDKFTKALADALFLVRPDGYVAATADRSEPEYIEGFLREWLSPATVQDNEPRQEELPLPPDEPMPFVRGSSASV